MQNKYPAIRFICHNFDEKRYTDNKKVQVTDEIKRDIWKYIRHRLTWQIIMCIKFLPVQNKYQATFFVCQNFEKRGY